MIFGTSHARVQVPSNPRRSMNSRRATVKPKAQGHRFQESGHSKLTRRILEDSWKILGQFWDCSWTILGDFFGNQFGGILENFWNADWNRIGNPAKTRSASAFWEHFHSITFSTLSRVFRGVTSPCHCFRRAGEVFGPAPGPHRRPRDV